MRRLHTALIGALAVAAAFVIPAAARAVQTAPFNALTIDNSAGMNGGISSIFTQMSITNNPPGFGLSATDPVYGTAHVDLGPPTGQTFTVGTYATDQIPDATHAAFDITQGSSACGSGTGSINIKAITYDASNNVTSFAASFTRTCPGIDPLAGEIRYNASVGYVGATEDVPRMDFGQQDLGSFTPKTVTISSVGSNPIVFQQATLGGTNPSAFAIASDTCSGHAVAGGSTCKITVQPVPTAPGSDNATLTIPDNSKLGYRYVELSAQPIVGSAGKFSRVAPARLLDTRHGIGAPKQPLGAGQVLSLQVTGRGEVPSGHVSAVVLNVTETSATRGGFLTVYPSGTTRPTVSNLNFTSGRTEANSVTVPVGADGKVNIYNYVGSVQVIADVSGYFAADDLAPGVGNFHPTVPSRLFDTRKGFGALSAHEGVYLPFTFNATINPHVLALVVNITAVGPTAPGYLSVWNGEGNPPATSTVNFPKSATVPNMAVVPTGWCLSQACGSGLPAIAVYNGQSTGHVDVLIDVIGYFDDGTLPNGLRFHPVAPKRITDTRSGLGAPHALGPGATATITAPSALIDDLTVALALNATAVGPTSSTFLTVWPSGARPTVSTLNPAAHQTVANATIGLLSTVDTLNVYNNAGTTNLLLDLAGTYELYPFSSTPNAVAANRAPAYAYPASTPVAVAQEALRW